MSERRGFSLVELLVSMTIFSFGVLGGVALLETGYRWEGRAELSTQVTVAAEMKIEDLKALAGTELPDTVELSLGGDLDADVSAHWDTVELDGRLFHRRWTVGIGPSGTRTLTVRAQPAKPAAPQRAELTTHVMHD